MTSRAEIESLVDQIKTLPPFESLEATRKLAELSRERPRSADPSFSESPFSAEVARTAREMREQMVMKMLEDVLAPIREQEAILANSLFAVTKERAARDMQEEMVTIVEDVIAPFRELQALAEHIVQRHREEIASILAATSIPNEDWLRALDALRRENERRLNDILHVLEIPRTVRDESAPAKRSG